MNNTKLEYQKRLHEIDLFFSVLGSLDHENCTISYTDILGERIEKSIDNELSKILKANGFLLLYNLVEATIRKSIEAIFVSMCTCNVTFNGLTDNMRKLWIKQEFKNSSTDDILLLSKKILENELLSFKANCFNISGNIDAQKIREISKQLGCNQLKGGQDLVIIKEKRNKLAHGEFTFSEIGRDYTMSDLVGFKDRTKEYLSNVLTGIETFINEKEFLN
ncbi:MAG: MAE_28990/MAE_18760 family HEPN-like nuclease [Paludibacteraceae bacterium]|nr:MAE_28990/MAE_18760 family HEPN-like nuclease [Paludibacteraceae bacterium]